MGTLIVAHGLRRQAAGDPAAFPADLRVALALGRSLRNGSIIAAHVHGTEVTRIAVDGADAWLRELDGRPDLLRAALAAVSEDDRTALTRVGPGGEVIPPAVLPGEPPEFDPRPHLLAERYVIRELQKGPGQWLPALLAPAGVDKEAVAPVVDAIGTAWSVPWERERGRRLLGLGFETRSVPGGPPLLRGRPGRVIFASQPRTPAELVETDRHLRLYRRALLVKLAVRLYQAERRGTPAGTAPAALADLVTAGCLRSVPTDPYDGQPLRYRVSMGELLAPLPARSNPIPGAPPPLEALPGQAIVWSVGANHQDDGGRGSSADMTTGTRADDVLFLVPLPPGQK
jgi:hypothetical protein